MSLKGEKNQIVVFVEKNTDKLFQKHALTTINKFTINESDEFDILHLEHLEVFCDMNNAAYQDLLDHNECFTYNPQVSPSYYQTMNFSIHPEDFDTRGLLP